jgi:acyl carrier protein phosphodiesterase
MNFLAHLYLSPPTPAAWIGSLLPDLHRGPLDPALPGELHAAAALHRRIDRITDTHPLFLRSRSRLFPYHGRFSGILTDVFYDHFLARGWSRWSREPLDGFVERVHGGLTSNLHLMPPAVRPIVERMCAQGWIGCYGSAAGLRLTLTRMSARFSARFGREVDLAGAVDLLDTLGDDIAGDFDAFFPVLIRTAGEPMATPAATPAASAAGG